MTLKGIRIHTGLISACAIAVGLLTASALMGQQEDRASTRQRAMALEQSGQNAEAEQVWNGIAKADPQNAEALAHLGLLEARQEHYERSIAYYRQASAIDPDLPGLQMNLGLALFKAAQFPDAIRSFTAELKKHPGDPRLTILLGMAHYGMKDYLVAIPYLQRAAEQDPQSVALRITLAHSCLSSKQYPCVLNVCKEILALKSDSAEADMLSGEALEQIGDKAGAAKALRAGVEANPAQPQLHFGLGYLLWTGNNWSEAANEFQLEIQNNPEQTKVRIYLADSWVHQGQFDKALPELEKLAASNPAESMVHLDLGLIDARKGRTEDAIRELRMAEQSDPEEQESHIEIARLYQSVGKREEAKAELETARSLPLRSHASLEETIDSVESPTP
ncbi:MAG: tetratricopeptide repeat protein [Terracidiphilus sp.]